MNKIEDYIDYIFTNNRENIKQYVLKETNVINFNVEKNIISNNKNIYSQLVEKYFQKDDDNDYIIRLFKIISLHNIDNIYIFESFIINIIAGSKIKDAILKTINHKKIINYNKGNISEEEILKRKFCIFTYFDNAYKYFPNYINNYIENVYKLTFEESYKEYNDNIIIPLMALVIGYYFNNNEKYIDRILEYADNINTLDSMLAISIIVDKNKKIENKFIELLKQLEKNNKNLIADFIYIARLPIENKYFFDFNNYDDYINYLKDLNADEYIIFLIKYLNNNIYINYNKIYLELIEIKKYDENTFNKIYEALELSDNNKYAIELMSILNLITNKNINIDYFLESLEKELEDFFNIKHIKYNSIYDLLNALKIYKDDLTIKLNERIIFLSNVLNWYYDDDEKAKKIVDSILESLPYNLMIPVIIRNNINLFNANINETIKKYQIKLKDLFVSYFNSYPIYILKSQYICELLDKNRNEIINLFNDIDFLNIALNKSYALIDFLDLIYIKNNFNDYSIIYNILNTDNEILKKYSLNIIAENEELNRKYVEDNLDNYKEFKEILKKWNYSKENFCFKSIEEIYDYVDYYYTDNELLDFLDNSYNILSKENTNIDIKVLKYILNEFLKIEKPNKIKDVEKILEFVDRKSFIETVEKAEEYFINNNLIEDNIKIITPYAIYADESHIEKLHQLLIDWNNSFKTPLIIYTMQSIAINGKTSALKMINKFALNSNNKEIKKNIKEILVYASEILNTNIDNIFERLFPNFGFNIEGKKIINYGKRSFQLQLLSDSYLEIFDIQNSSIIKELPEAENDEDLEMVKKAKEDFLYTKQTLKEIINYEEIKLTRALINGRKWDYKTFFEVFIDNPIMRYFTLSFVWGVYDENNVLIDSFRYMEDGAFVTADDELYELPDSCYIGIYNIIDDDIEKFYKWKEQFELYGIEQPINQFMNELITLKEENVKYDSIIMFEGIKIDTSYINQLCRELDIKDTYFNDNASYMIFDDVLKIVCKINAFAYGEEIVLGSIEFYELEKNERLGKKINPFEISQKFVSSMLYYLSLGLYE